MFSRYLPIISIFLLILLILAGIFFWWPKVEETLDLREKLKIKEAEVKQREEYPKKLIAISHELEQYSDELDKIDSALPEEPSIPVLFNYIQKTTSENGLILESVSLTSVSSAKDKIGVREVSFSVSATGSYSSFKNFLASIYINARLIDIKSISFTSPDEETGLFNFSLNFATYAFSEEQDLPGNLMR